MFTEDDKILMIENIRNAKNRVRLNKDPNEFIDVFDLMAKIPVPNGDLVADALIRSSIKNYDHVLMKKGTYVISTLLYNITIRYVGDILRRLCMYGSSGTCSCPLSRSNGEICVGIHKCDDFIDQYEKDYMEISHD